MSTIRSYADVELHGSIIRGTELSDFPTNPVRNQDAFVNGVLWIYSEVEGILTWFPLNNKKTTYVHTQSVPSQDWFVQHDRNTDVFIIQVYDANNNLMNGYLTDVTDNDLHVNFTEAVTGRVVMFFETETFLPAVSTASVTTDSLSVGGGAVTADANGLSVNGNPVVTLNSQGQADFGSL